jgi:hypothetical protein
MASAIKVERSRNTDSGDSSDASNTPNFATRHYSVSEIASLWNLSDDAVRKIFEQERGVLVLGNAVPRRGTRSYTTLRIPEEVVDRVHKRLTKGVDCASC